MSGSAEMLILGFLVGLTGALSPGPMLVAAINASMKEGWAAGPKVALGHLAVEFLIIVLITAGLYGALAGYSSLIAGFGGIALIVFGALVVLESRQAQIDATQNVGNQSTPFIAGSVTSVGNPYFWIWWLTVGSPLLIGALQGGLMVMIAFIAGHWSATLGWYTLVSASIHRGRFFLSTREYRIVLASCGIFLVVFGVYYVSTVIS